jgi:hypothetical protein
MLNKSNASRDCATKARACKGFFAGNEQIQGRFKTMEQFVVPPSGGKRRWEHPAASVSG